MNDWTTGESAQMLFLDEGNYQLSETSVPDDYVTAVPIYFTVSSNKAAVQTITMTDLKLNQEESEIVIPTNIGNLEIRAENWAHKLSEDVTNGIKLNGEILLWKGDLYYVYNKYQENNNVFQIPSENASSYAKKSEAELIAANAPDPIEYLQQYFNNSSKNDTAANYVVKINSSNIKTGIGSFSQGDLLYLNNKIYVYVKSEQIIINNAEQFNDYQDHGFYAIDSTKASIVKNATN